MVVITLTNFTALPYRKECLEMGADFFPDKPTEIGKLNTIIQAWSRRLSSKRKDHSAGFN